MSIERFAYHDHSAGWELAPVDFGPLNLLVGLSGVGKTRTLEALHRVARAAAGEARLPGCQWSITVGQGDARYTWTATVEAPEGFAESELRLLLDEDDSSPDRAGQSAPRFVHEQITTAAGEILLTRDESTLTLAGASLPQLKDTESALSLLRHEAAIRPVYAALRAVRRSEAHRRLAAFHRSNLLRQLQERCRTFEDLQQSSAHLLARASVMQTCFPAQFSQFQAQYVEIFPTVAAVNFGPLSQFRPELEQPVDWLVVAVEERGVARPIITPELSSGMLRALLHLLEVTLAPSGSVFLVDEYENSLGVNCLSEVTRLLSERAGALQFIFTSHHPYVINAISMESWKVLRREGAKVTAMSAATIPRLTGLSRQEAFTQLLNAPEYYDGISA